MKIKMKGITILIIYTISVTLTFGAGKSNDKMSESIVKSHDKRAELLCYPS